MRKIDLSKRASEFLINLPPKQCKQNLAAILKLSQEVKPNDAKKLQGYTDLYRIDVGEYRIIYRCDGENIYILLNGSY